jgi:hypothetical protein
MIFSREKKILFYEIETYVIAPAIYIFYKFCTGSLTTTNILSILNYTLFLDVKSMHLQISKQPIIIRAERIHS